MKNAWRLLGAGALILLVTVVAYLPALRGGFVWDDDAWTTGIPGLVRDSSGLRLMWHKPTALQQYYPLTGTSFWLDYHLWGFRTLPYHVENVFLHASAAILFWILLRRLQLPGAWLAGAIFALHPVMVESVAWITERKNVLSLVFYLSALLAYGRFTRFWKEENGLAAAPKGPQQRDWMAYALAWVLFLAALLAKATAFSLPAVILLICWWKRGRIQWRLDVLPALPFFALTVGLGLVTVWLEKNHLGAQGPEWAISFPARCLIAGRASWFYIGKLVWPTNLCFVYPRWQLDVRSLRQWLYPIAAVSVLLGLWCARARIGRGPVATALFFVGTLFPVLGFLNAYFMRFSFVCDHLTYLPSLGLIALAAALITRAAGHFRTPAALYGLAAVLLLVLATLTWRQARVYTDIETLWRDTLTRNPGAWMAHNNLGTVLLPQGKALEAIEHYEVALRLKPDSAEVHSNLGNALLHQGKVLEAIAQYQQALRLRPDYAEAHNNLGNALLQQGEVSEAIRQYERVLQLNFDSAEAHYNLGDVLLRMGRVQEAVGHFEHALRVKPDFVGAHNRLGSALLRLSRSPDAIRHFEQALQINPENPEAHNNLGNALLGVGRVTEAVGQYEQALRFKPDYAEAHNNLGNALLGVGRVTEAVGQYEQALRFKPDYAEAHNNLGNALLQLGRGSEAIGEYEQAVRIRPDFVEARNNLGLALVRQGRTQEAIRHWEQALQIDPDYAEVHYNLGVALELVGRVQEAIGHYEQAVRIRPDFAKAQSRLARLRTAQ